MLSAQKTHLGASTWTQSGHGTGSLSQIVATQRITSFRKMPIQTGIQHLRKTRNHLTFHQLSHGILVELLQVTSSLKEYDNPLTNVLKVRSSKPMSWSAKKCERIGSLDKFAMHGKMWILKYIGYKKHELACSSPRGDLT